ncbi:hypothetical protein AtNW77_Chr3g0213811 [Arabidopsis thaliana]|jgi:insulysin
MAIENAAAASGECGVILKARTDKREYRRIVLKNSLEVLLISDPETQRPCSSFTDDKNHDDSFFAFFAF